MRKVKKLKVFHGLVNYGTQSGLFARALRERGISAISVTSPDPFKRETDIELLHGGSFFQKIFKHSWNWARRVYWFFKYNTFHFYYGTTLFPKQIDLPLYKFFKKKVIMEYLGYDVQLYQYSIEKYEITNVKYYYPHDISIKADKIKIARLKSESRYLDKQLVCAPSYTEFVTGSSILPLALDLKKYRFSPKEPPGKEIVILHAPTSRGNKGTSFIINAIDKLKDEGYKIRLLLIENVTHDELKQKYIACDLYVEEIIHGWYGTTSIEAMALGRPTICFIRESYYEHINFGEDIPVINAEPSSIYEVLKRTIDEKHLFPEIGKKSRLFVENVHDLNMLTDKLIDIYNKLWYTF